jgi:hydrogenase maturation protein HypF
MDLEFASMPGIADSYPFELTKTKPILFDWQSAVLEILNDCRNNRSPGIMAAMFHNTLAELIVAVAYLAKEENVVLSGGCFQNHYLTEAVVRRLREEGFSPHWHRCVPPNDGGIALGQAVAASRVRESEVQGSSRTNPGNAAEAILDLLVSK